MICDYRSREKFILQGISFDNTGILDLRGLLGVEGVSPHFQKVRFTVTVDTGESEDRIEELKNEVEKRCPVYNLLKDSGVELNSKWVEKPKTVSLAGCCSFIPKKGFINADKDKISKSKRRNNLNRFFAFFIVKSDWQQKYHLIEIPLGTTW